MFIQKVFIPTSTTVLSSFSWNLALVSSSLKVRREGSSSSNFHWQSIPVWECAVSPGVCLYPLGAKHPHSHVIMAPLCHPGRSLQPAVPVSKPLVRENLNDFSSSATLLMSCHCQVVRKLRVGAFIFLVFCFPQIILTCLSTSSCHFVVVSRFCSV